MSDRESARNAANQLIVEFKGSIVTLKRANGGPIIEFTHQEWHDIKMGKYDPPQKKQS